MPKLLIHKPQGFGWGYTPIVKMAEDRGAVGINFGILKLKQGMVKDLTSPWENAYLLIQGKVIFSYNDKNYVAKRSSIFDEDPIAIHFAKNTQVIIKAQSNCELAVFQVKNLKQFATKVFDAKNMLAIERRGKGMLENTSYRIVRTIFDHTNRPEAKLVLGEDLNFQGRWSSYPPHHHAQPEIYHYRFTKPQGYGHAELGEKVFKIHNYDTIKILNKNDHAQVAAPGYMMYYIWAIRHLPNHPYIKPEFTRKHRWLLKTKRNLKFII